MSKHISKKRRISDINDYIISVKSADFVENSTLLLGMNLETFKTDIFGIEMDENNLKHQMYFLSEYFPGYKFRFKKYFNVV